MSAQVCRLDHVAVAVRETEAALAFFRDRLGLDIAHTQVLDRPHVRLTYLDAGNTFIQLVEPLDPEGELAAAIARHGEGLHHICFGVDDVLEAARAISPGAGDPVAGTGRGRVSAFVPGSPPHGVRIECTEFDLVADVERTVGWLERGRASSKRTPRSGP